MTKKISVVEKIHSANDQLAAENKQQLDQADLFSLNIMASPGAGKTSIIEKSLEILKSDYKIAAIDGDVATSIDADRAAEAGATAVQINTGGQCHIDAHMLRNALMELDLDKFDLLLVENVGNLICPASFKLGTDKNVLIASIPEGDDKPYKYPAMYQDVDALIINKIDLLPYVKFDMEYFQKGVQMLNPDLITFPVSCTTGKGIEAWVNWVSGHIKDKKVS
ncbi:MAG: hydrogenase accessory protein HypB [Chloroflexota bacterium]|nr:MAG: hydrogenase accessory protein HypB [Chloroflexota bacterium]HDD62333.1 hydrogenase accessory protein HypB [Chloroflexota bacterium]